MADESNRSLGDKFSRVVAPPELYEPERRKTWKLEENDGYGPYIIELNLQHLGGLPGAATALSTLMALLEPDPEKRPTPVYIAKTYRRCDFTFEQWTRLLALDEQRASDEAAKAKSAGQTEFYRAIYKLWPDFPVYHQTDRSISTIKADAALKSFDAAGEGITWAVVDSGVDGDHPHFGDSQGSLLRAPLVQDLHRCFVTVPVDHGGLVKKVALDDPDDPALEGNIAERTRRLDEHRQWALRDDFGHGTHVAGIIAGRAPTDRKVWVMQRVGSGAQSQGSKYEERQRADTARLRGVAPRARLVSLRVLDESGNGRSSDIIRALEYIREKLNDNPKMMRVHGVNLSVGYEFDAEMFACGQSPLCSEVDRLVQSGVVVVAAAGNTGYGTVATSHKGPTKMYLSNSINDPGNAQYAITVGATHRDSPHTYGVSFFSSKGPTGDGRLKPDLVAPGERITSCAAGLQAEAVRAKLEDAAQQTGAYYVEDSGTSMAAPHVSGAIAAFLSIRQEFIGRPLDVKKIFLDAATPLGRERYFEGRGLLDLMRAIQSV